MDRMRYTFLVEYEVDPSFIAEQVVAIATGGYRHMEKRDVAQDIHPRRAILVKTEKLREPGDELPSAAAPYPERAREAPRL